MQNVPKAALAVIGASALAACAGDDGDQNIIIDNNVSAGADIEAVPADESSATPSGELVNGAAEDNAAADNMSANNSL